MSEISLKSRKRGFKLSFRYGLVLFFLSYGFMTIAQEITVRTDEYIKDQQSFEQTGAVQWICPDIITLETSSELLTESSFHHKSSQLKDAKFNTAWIEGEQGLGEGSKIIITFLDITPQDWKFDGNFFFVNGYAFSPEIWEQHSRVKSFNVYMNQKFIRTIQLEDSPNLQWITFHLTLQGNDEIIFEIAECYQGTLYQDTAIAMLVPTCLF